MNIEKKKELTNSKDKPLLRKIYLLRINTILKGNILINHKKSMEIFLLQLL